MLFFLASTTALTSEHGGSTILLLLRYGLWPPWMLSTTWGLLGTLLMQKEPLHSRNELIYWIGAGLGVLSSFHVFVGWSLALRVTLKPGGPSAFVMWGLPSLGVVSGVGSLSFFRRNDLRRICCVLRARCLKARAEP